MVKKLLCPPVELECPKNYKPRRIRLPAESSRNLSLVDGGRVSGFVFRNLESEELLDSGERMQVGCSDYNAPACRRFFELVRDLAVHLFHNWNTGRYGVVDKHRNFKIATGKGLRDM